MIDIIDYIFERIKLLDLVPNKHTPIFDFLQNNDYVFVIKAKKENALDSSFCESRVLNLPIEIVGITKPHRDITELITKLQLIEDDLKNQFANNGLTYNNTKITTMNKFYLEPRGSDINNRFIVSLYFEVIYGD